MCFISIFSLLWWSGTELELPTSQVCLYMWKPKPHLYKQLCVCPKPCSTLQPYRLQPARLLCPWNFPGNNTGVGCCFLLQGIFLTQASNQSLFRLLHWQADSLPRRPLEAHSTKLIGRQIYCFMKSNNIDFPASLCIFTLSTISKLLKLKKQNQGEISKTTH